MLGDEYLKMFEAFREFGLSKYIYETRQTLLQSITGPYFSQSLKNYLLPIQKKGAPYRNFASDPVEVVQIKNFFNALYHTEMALADLEKISPSLKSTHSDLKKLWSSTVSHAYQASFLLTTLDPEVLSAFSTEINKLKQIMILLQRHSDALNDDTVAQIKESFTAYKAGRVTGIAIHQLENNQTEVDFAFLNDIFAKTPQYIDKLSQLIKEHSGAEPNIDERQIQMLQDDSIRIVQGLEDLYHSNRLVKPFKVLRYIYLLRHIASVTNSIIEQVNYANDSTQKAIVDKMIYLKYDLLQELFILSDKIEDYGMLQPGVISNPLMKKMENLYDILSAYVQKVVDFDANDTDLRILNDSVFQSRRLDALHQRLIEQQVKLEAHSDLSDAFDRFYQIIDKHPNTAIQDIPEPHHAELVKEYHQVQDLMQKHDPQMHARMVNALASKATKKEGWGAWIIENGNWLLGRGPEKTNWLQTLKADLKRRLESQQNAILFRIEIASSLSDKIQEEKSSLSCYRNSFEVHAINEPELIGITDDAEAIKHKALKLIDTTIMIPARAEQALHLKQRYQQKSMIVERALRAYEHFCELSKQKPIDEAAIEQLKIQYICFQPWLYAQNEDKSAIDKMLTQALNKNPLDQDHLNIACQKIIDNHDTFKTELEEYKLFYEQRATQWDTCAKEISLAKQEHSRIRNVNPAKQSSENKKYSKIVAEYRQSLLNLRSLLSPAMQKQLEIEQLEKRNFHLTSIGGYTVPWYSKQSSLPYPEMEDAHSAYSQPQQVAIIKRLYNGFYYLEGILTQLEKLDARSSQSVYVYHLIMSYSHIIELYNTSKQLYDDPYCRLIAKEFLSKIYDVYEKIQPEIQAYQVASEDIHSIETPVQYPGFWYAMNAFMILPEQLKSKKSKQAQDIEVQKAKQVKAKKMVTDIERIINVSDSYFKLFLESPTMIRLLIHLRRQANELIENLHDVSMANLKNIDTELFFTMLKEADALELRLGLKPGLLSEPLEQILDKYYLGLIEALELNSEQEFGLLFNNERIAKRKEVISKTAQEAQVTVNKSEFEKKTLLLLECLDAYTQITGVNIRSDQSIEKTIKNKIAKCYKTIKGSFENELKIIALKKEMIALNKILVEGGKVSLSKDGYRFLIEKADELIKEQGPLAFYTNEDEGLRQNRLYQYLFQSGLEKKEKFQTLDYDKSKIPNLACALNVLAKQYEAELALINDNKNQQEALDKILKEYKIKPEKESLALLNYLNAIYQKKSATFTLKKETAQEQLRYCEKLEQKQIKNKVKHRKAYIAKKLDKEVEKIQAQYIGLDAIAEEYQQAFKIFIDHQKKQICTKVKDKKDIKKALEVETERLAQAFAIDNYQSYAHLNAILMALENVNQYCNREWTKVQKGSSVYENDNTLRMKLAITKELKTICLDESKSVEDRVEAFQSKIITYSSASSMTKQVIHQNYGMPWLKQWCLYLLNLVGLYQSQAEKNYKALCSVAKKEDKTFSLPPKYQFFAKKEETESLGGLETIPTIA
jgi:hypothetical protein